VAPAGGMNLIVASETVTIGLSAMPIVFAVFVGLQAREMVGGDAWVQATTGLTYAEFARQGFFQMVAATLLSLRCCTRPSPCCRPMMSAAAEPCIAWRPCN